MGSIGSQLGFGRNECLKGAVRAYEQGGFKEAVDLFKAFLTSDPDPSTRERCSLEPMRDQFH